jgi:hypothetical protein
VEGSRKGNFLAFIGNSEEANMAKIDGEMWEIKTRKVVEAQTTECLNDFYFLFE